MTVTLADAESSLNIARNCQVDHADVLHAIDGICAALTSDADTGAVWVTDSDARDIYKIFAPQH